MKSSNPKGHDENLLTRLFCLVEDERAVAQARISELWSKPLSERVAMGRAIGEARVEEISTSHELTLYCPSNESLFREGDILRLSRGNPFEEGALNASLEVDNDDWVTLSMPRETDWEHFRSEPEGWVLDEGYLDLSAFYDKALEDVANSRNGRDNILPMLRDERQPEFDPEEYQAALEYGEQAGLNETQAEGLAHAYASDLVYLIQGPPGTGKTRVLAELAAMLVRRGERVLITSLTHRAINNALEKLVDTAPHIPLVKVGRPVRTPQNVLNVERFNDWKEGRDLDAFVVGMTPFACRGPRAGGLHFDTVIFDESSQITLPLALMAMLAGERYIFLGDHQQLPPVLQSRDHLSALQESVFGVLAERGYTTLLETSYRLNDQLIEWPSQNFYAGKLYPSDQAATRRLPTSELLPSQWQAVLSPEPCRLLLEMPESASTTRNALSAQWIVSLCSALVYMGLPESEIGIISPFRAQGRMIRRSLRKQLPDSYREIVADTVERMQGQEKEVVIVDFVVGSANAAFLYADFLLQPQRLNVAVTRPRSKLILLATPEMLDFEPANDYQQAARELCRELFSRCSRVTGPDPE